MDSQCSGLLPPFDIAGTHLTSNFSPSILKVYARHFETGL